MADDAPILLLAALRAEMDPVAATLGLPRSGPLRVGRVKDQSIIALVTGMGAPRMCAALGKAIDTHRPQNVILIGFAGALSPSLAAGDIVRVIYVMDERSRGLMVGGGLPPEKTDNQANRKAETMFRHDTLLSADRIITSVAQKRHLYEAYGASAVDLESFSVAELAAARSVPLTIIRAISDPHGMSLPSQVGEWVSADGSPRMAAAIWGLIKKPTLLRTVLKLRSHARIAANRLAAEVLACLTIWADDQKAADAGELIG